MPTETPKHLLMVHFARVAKALAHEHRLELIEFLAQGERSVEGLVELTGLPVANVSQHLQHLRRAGLVTGRREGKYVYYRISGDEVVKVLGALHNAAEANVAEVRELVRTFFDARDNLEAVTMDDLMQRMEDGLVTVIDVRPEDEFMQGHVPGAVNIPMHELEKRLKELPKGREIIAYCRGRYCMFSFEAVALLRRKGLQARRMEDGFPEWVADGRPVASNAIT